MEENYNFDESPIIKKPKKKKRLWLLLFIIPLLVIGGIYGYNYFTLQVPMNKVIEGDNRNSGIDVTVKYDSYINFETLIYDLENFSGKAPIDIFRVFLQYAEAKKSDTFDYIVLSYRRKEKFKITGKYFKQLGSEYSTQNPIYTTRTFPENLLKMDGTKAYGTWTGGILGVLKEQMEDFNDFIKKWIE